MSRDITLRLTSKTTIKSKKTADEHLVVTREGLAKRVSATMLAMRERHTSFEPYKPNEWTDTGWVLDDGNDFRIFFDDADDKTFRLSCRYGWQMEALRGVAVWIAHEMGCEMLDTQTPVVAQAV
jgi:hypothetical protein